MHTLVIGGGFAGVKAAIEISKRQLGRVTLMADSPYLYDRTTARAVLAGHSLAATLLALDDLLAAHPEINLIQDKLVSLDPDRNLAIGAQKHYHYDTLVLALEQEETSPDATPGTDPYGAATLKKIHDHFYDAIAYDRHVDRNYAIIGGGETGVAMAGMLASYINTLAGHHLTKKAKIRLTLVESQSRILPALSRQASQQVTRHLQKLGVETITGHAVSLKDTEFVTIGSKKIPRENVIWATGQRSNPFFDQHRHYFDVTPTGSVAVNPYLEAYRHIYVVGDNADLPTRPSVHRSLDMGNYIADHLARSQAGGILSAYRAVSPSTNVALGTDWAYIELLGVYIVGNLAAKLSRRLTSATYGQIMPKTMAQAALRVHSTELNGSIALRKA